MVSQDAWWRVEEPGNAGCWTATTPVASRAQLGFVRLWPARTVDVRLFWGADAPLPREKSEDGKSEGTQTLELEELDGLAKRLALVLQTPPEVWLREEGALAWEEELYSYQKEGILAILGARQLLESVLKWNDNERDVVLF